LTTLRAMQPGSCHTEKLRLLVVLGSCFLSCRVSLFL
jgi:hypothetical protein